MKKIRETAHRHPARPGVRPGVRPIEDDQLEDVAGGDDWEAPIALSRPLTGIYELVDGRLVRV